MTIKRKTSSRLNYSRLITLGGVEHWELPEYPEVLPANDDIIHEVKRTDRIDMISNAYYDTPDLWWVIAVLNNMRLLPNDLAARAEIRIASPRRVFAKILRNPGRGREGRG